MGITVSKYSDISTNELVERFCSNEIICPNDPFWNQLLAFNIQIPTNADEQLILDSSSETLLQNFLQNNQQTGNLGSLVQVFITRATELLAAPNSDNIMLAWQCYNALFLIRAVTKYLVELIPEYEVCRHLDVQVRIVNVKLWKVELAKKRDILLLSDKMAVRLEMYSEAAREGAISALRSGANTCAGADAVGDAMRGLTGNFRKLEVD